ncbi:DUF4838 domain-containing protein [Bacteroidota bacterium]
MNKFHLFITLLFLVIISACQDLSKLKIVDNGTSDYKIMIPSESDDLEKKAAEELQKYIQHVTGINLPLIIEGADDSEKVIWVGNTTKLSSYSTGKHQILITVNDNKLIIAGGSSKSTLDAVYTFLEEQLGCRFYTSEVEHIPTLKSIEFAGDFNYSYTPPVTTRTVHSQLYYDNHNFADKRKVTYEAFPGYVPVARVHTFHRFLPEDKFYHSHPEYFALRNGKRLPTQLCLTNEDVFRIVRDSVASMLKRYPEADVISVSQDDNGQHCQCEHCKAIDDREGSPSGSMIEFVNAIANEFPDKMISTLAYQYTRKAPATLKPAPNVLITLCSIECDRSAPIEDNCRDFAQDLIDWGKLTDNIRIWDYTTQFTNFLAPFPNLYTLQPNIKLFRDNNAKWIFEQHSHNPSELFELRSYLTAKLLWNPDVDLDSIMSDFLTGYYDEAAPYIANYINTVHEELDKNPDYFLFLYGDPAQAFSSFLKPELLKVYDTWYDQAEEAVAEKSEVLQRVKVARLSVDYAILEASRKNLSAAYTLIITGTDGKRKVSDRLANRLKNFKQTCLANEIKWMNETRFSVDEYMALYNRTIERAIKPNYALGKDVTLLQPPLKYADEDPQVLTDGAFGGGSFFANWLGFEGNDLEAIIDFGDPIRLTEASCAFLQVTNHVVFFPKSVTYYFSNDGENFIRLGRVRNKRPLTKQSKVNDIQYFPISFYPKKIRYMKVVGENMGEPPVWHHAAGTSSWIFIDEIEVR